MKKFLSIFILAISLILGEAKAETIAHIPDNPSSALIIIHGFGGNAHTLSWMTNKLKEALPDTAFYYPEAPDKAPVGNCLFFRI